MSHKSRNLRRKIYREWAVKNAIKQRKSVYWPAMNIHIVFSNRPEFNLEKIQ